MKKLLPLLMLLVLSACSKEVSSTNTSLTPRTGNPVVEAPPDVNSGTIRQAFANHAQADEENQLTQSVFAEPLLISFSDVIAHNYPQVITSRPALGVWVNGEMVCKYVWRASAYRKDSCDSLKEVFPNDVLTVTGIPKLGSTVTLEIKFQR